MSITVAAYTIVRNEANHAHRWADSLRQAGFDYLFWLDTGSTDNTVPTAKSAQINTAVAAFDPFRFDDARNAALALLPTSVDFAIQIDADETVDDRPWRKELLSHLSSPHGPGRPPTQFRYVVQNDDPGYWSSVVRANLHARHGYRWRYPIHEVVQPSLPSTHQPSSAPTLHELALHHRPDPQKSRSSYLPLLQAAVAESPDDARMAFYYARELMFTNDWTESRKQFERFIALPTANWNAERSEAYRHLAQMDYFPLRWILKAIAESPDRREPWVDLVNHYLSSTQSVQAQGALVSAMQRTDPTIYSIASTSAWGSEFEALVSRVFPEGVVL